MNLDADWVIAISTIVLVGVTAFYAWRTSSIATGTAEMAAATRRSVDVATTMLVLQHAPIVVPRPGGGGGSKAFGGNWEVGVVLYNMGSAPAFGIDLAVSFGDKTLEQGSFVSLEPKQERKTKFAMLYGEWAAAGEVWSAEVRYRDVLSRSYTLRRSTTGQLEIELEGQPLRLPSSLQTLV